VNPIGHAGDEPPQEIGGGASRRALMELGEGEFAHAVDGYKQEESSFPRPDLREVNMDVADRVRLESLTGPAAVNAR
jgi:hypothetical protein